jgi:hypothetical protein
LKMKMKVHNKQPVVIQSIRSMIFIWLINNRIRNLNNNLLLKQVQTQFKTAITIIKNIPSFFFLSLHLSMHFYSHTFKFFFYLLVCDTYTHLSIERSNLLRYHYSISYFRLPSHLSYILLLE